MSCTDTFDSEDPMKAKKKKYTSLAILSIPALSLLIFVQQVYRQNAHDLTIWKGGGMGMFAGADGPDMRFLHIIGTDTAGTRHPILRLTVKHKKLREKILIEPKRDHFRNLSCAILGSDWWTTNEFRQIMAVEDTEPISIQKDKPFSVIAPYKSTVSSQVELSSVTLRFFKTHYIRSRSYLYAELDKEFTFEQC